MKNKNIIKTLLSCLVLVALQSCEEQEISTYNSQHSLFFERWKQISSTERQRIDTVAYSFSHYVGETELTHKFQIKLIGDTLTEDKEYRVVVVDSLTTALPEQYSLPEHPTFRKGTDSDEYAVTILRKPSLKDKEVYLTLRLTANDNFGLGYVMYRDVKIRFNDMIVPPLWWTTEIRDAYLGPYSYEKLETIIAANKGFTTFEGLSDTERRKIALNTKTYIKRYGITEKNGDPMVIPMY